jgi:hypothetical protein
MSSRRQSMFPPVPPRPPWRQNSTASQPIRRPSEWCQPIIARRGTEPSDHRRSSCMTRLGNTPCRPGASPHHTISWREASAPLRKLSSQSEKGETIKEETKISNQCHEVVKLSSSTMGSCSSYRECKFGGTQSLSTRVSDV